MSGLSRFTRIEFKLYLREFLNIFFAIAFPLLMLLLFGSIYGNEPSDFFGGFGTVDALVPAYICLVIAVNGLMSLPLTIADYRNKKILKRFKATPINPRDILISQYLVMLVMTVFSTILMIVVGKIVFNLQFFGQLLPIVVAYLMIVASIFSIGILIAGVSPSGKTAVIISYLVYFPMLFLSGATLPLNLMPPAMIRIANILPLTYGVRLLSNVWLGQGLAFEPTNIAVLLGIFAVCSALALKLFKWE